MFQSPMIIHKGAHIFVGDIVEFTDRGEEVLCRQCYGKVLKYNDRGITNCIASMEAL